MEPETYEQVTVSEDVMGDSKVYPDRRHDGLPEDLQKAVAIAIELPQRSRSRSPRPSRW